MSKDRILYDRWYAAEFARPNLDTYLQKLYHDESQLLVFFLCKEYNEKEWCGLEWRASRDLLKRRKDDQLMFLRLDDADIPGLYSIDGYVDISKTTDQKVADFILQRVDLLSPRDSVTRQYRTFTSKLPTVNTLLIGRDDKIVFLDQAWANPDTNFVQIIAPGGTGKTALVDKWFRRYVGKITIFGWSFYSQGVSTQHATSSDPFFAEILSWLKTELAPSASVYAKADAVASRLRQERMLLILDGIEPLQDSNGNLLDSALKALLQELSTENRGLVLCTTRVRLDISDDVPRAVSIDLENLISEYGARYLQALGVKGEEQQLQQASEDFGNHALALTLLGTYLVDFLDADIRRRVEIRELMINESKFGPHARRMMAAYERIFSGKREADILRALGFFDRPADPGALKLVLPAMQEFQYRAALNRLYDARLVLAKDPIEPVDCHPLIREHFAVVMRSKAAEEFRQGHSRLFEYYSGKAPEQPDSLAEMTPLFHAVYHGCQGGLHTEVLNGVYGQRILRRNNYYLVHVLGGLSINLSLLANFFEIPWFQPIATIHPRSQTWLLSMVGFTLRGVGRLVDALDPIRSAAERRIHEMDLPNAAVDYGNFSELLLCLGRVQDSVSAARRSVEIANQSDEWTKCRDCMAVLANVLLQSGDMGEAHQIFSKAEGAQFEKDPEYPALYSVEGSHFCDLLLEKGKNIEVIRRATQTLTMAQKYQNLIAIGHDHLSLGRAYPPGSSKRTYHLDQAVHFLRQSGSLDDLPLALLARGTLGDLDEVFRIATRSDMKLHLTDYHLASARLALANHDFAKARDHFQQAETLINETGYHRRDKQLEELRVELAN